MPKLMTFAACLLLGLSLAAQAPPTQTKPSAPAAQRSQAAAPIISGTPSVTFDTTAGQMRCALYPNKAPKGVENFIGLALGTKEWTDPNTGKKKRGVPLYDGTIFHRVIPNFMIQGGDPLGTGMGGPGYSINDELSPDLKFDVPGRLAYANSGPNTNGSQFFITEVPNPHLDACFDAAGCNRGRPVPQGYGYVIFGQCDPSTIELVKQISRRARDDRNDRPFEPVTINKVSISGVSMPAKKPATRKPATTKKTPPKT
ncbi:MAG: peptidylprolyl isomerase [Acidobacteriales bacterium]|nr:peptidylprolyl isomerase [Terriglobales bacterium]